MSKWGVVKELHREARKNFNRRRSHMHGIANTIQADLIEMPNDRGAKYCLTVIDTFSKMAYVQPLKTKTGPEVTHAMKIVLDSIGKPIMNLQVDLGKEFWNSHMTKLLEKYKVNRYSTYSSKKAAIIERFNRTIQKKIYQQFSLRGNYKWIDIIQDLVDEYNRSKHRTIKMAPKDVDSDNEQQLLDTVYNYKRFIPFRNKLKFKIGDHVRLSKYKNVFAKGYLPNWTTEVFTVRKVQNTQPITYLLKDWEGKDILGGVYAEELQLVKYPDVYLVGFNSWVNENDVL